MGWSRWPWWREVVVDVDVDVVGGVVGARRKNLYRKITAIYDISVILSRLLYLYYTICVCVPVFVYLYLCINECREFCR